MKTLIPLIKDFKDTSIFVVGDIMLDVFVFGTVERISPEAPVPIMKIEQRKETLGGAGNVVRNLSSLGCNVQFAGVTGFDAYGDRIEALLKEIPRLEFTLERTVEPAIVKSRYVSNNHQILRTDVEQKIVISEGLEESILQGLAYRIQHVDVVVISDYNKGTITYGLAQKIIALCNIHNVPVFIDPKGKEYSKYNGATLIKPNLDELKEYFAGADIANNEFEFLQKLHNQVHVKYCLLTRGKEGMILFNGRQSLSIDSLKKEVFDVSGAGDSVMATLAAAYGAGSTIEDAVRLGNIAGGIVVGKSGTAVVWPHELIQEMQVVCKVYDQESLLEMVEYWRRCNYSIGFTNGCFDLLHYGHISLLKFAKSHCDKLIVGLNSDDSIRALKGKGRPVKQEGERAIIMAEFNCVDAVVVFDALTPELLIQSLKPDVLVKGGDYQADQIVGATFVNGYGGKVLTSEYQEGFSSTKLVEHISKDNL